MGVTTTDKPIWVRYEGGYYERREEADHWDKWTNVRWPGVICFCVWRARAGGWKWKTSHLGRDETEYGSGTAATLADAKKQALTSADDLS